MAVVDNQLLTDSVIAKEALRLLKNNLVAAKCVYRNYERTFGKVGDSISIKLPYRVKSASGRTLVKQPLVDQTVSLVADQQEHVGLEYTVKDLTLSLEQFSDRYLKSGMVQLANSIDRSILLTLKTAFHSSGTPGTRPSTYLDFATASAKQDDYGVPYDNMRYAVMNPITMASVSSAVAGLFQPQMVGDTYQRAYDRDLAGYVTHKSQNVPTHSTGSFAGTPLIAGPQANGNTLQTDGWTPSTNGVLLAGDVITIDGVFGVNPQNYQSTGRLQDFVVQQDVNSDAGGLATIEIGPSMNDGTATAGPVSLAAYQNINALPADNAPINLWGSPSTTYEQSYLFHRDAIALAMIDLQLPQTAVVKSRANDPDTGLSLSLTGAYDINEQSEIHRIDAVWGTKAVYPELALRLWGDNV